MFDVPPVKKCWLGFDRNLSELSEIRVFATGLQLRCLLKLVYFVKEDIF